MDPIGHPNQHFYRKSRKSEDKIRLITRRERLADLRQESLTQPRHSRMMSMSSDAEIKYHHPVPTEASTSAAERTQAELKYIQESDNSDDALGEDVEITEGGWICRVEQFEKHVDSEGHVHFRHPRKEHRADAREPEILNQDQKEKNVQRSIISCISHTTRDQFKVYIERENYIEIKSPLILEILRRQTSYGQQVWPQTTCRSRDRPSH